MKVFALCRTYFQVAQTLALCELFKKQGKNPELTIFRGKTSLNNFAIKSEALNFSIQDYPVAMLDLPNSSLAVMPLAITSLIVASLKKSAPQNVMVAPGAPNLFFLSIVYALRSNVDAFYSIEEGIGTYGSMRGRTSSKMYKHKTYSFYFPIYLGVEIIKQVLLRTLTYRSGGIIETISTRIESNPKNRIMLASILKDILSSDVFGASKVIIPQNTILFLSAPFVERKTMNKTNYLSILDATQSYFKDLGKNFIVKPHPNEKIDKFSGYMICDFEGPVEALLGAHRHKIVGVVGINSTALILARKLFHLPAYQIDRRLTYPLSKIHSKSNLQRLRADHTEVLHPF